jgi:DNA-directed RNA polymerase specialized sigma24 family protein
LLENSVQKSLPQFRPLDEAGLQRLDDDALIDYIRRARAAGHPSARPALAILVFGRMDSIERRVRLKVTEHEVEDLAADILVEAITSSFDGRSVGEFTSWLNTITGRAIADFYRRGRGRALPEPAGGADPVTASEEGEVDTRDVIERLMAPLRPDHRRVIDIMVFENGTAADAVRAVPGMTEGNAHQIVSRFRRALRDELEDGGDTASG